MMIHERRRLEARIENLEQYAGHWEGLARKWMFLAEAREREVERLKRLVSALEVKDGGPA